MANNTSRTTVPATVTQAVLSLDHATGVFQMNLSGPMNDMILCYLLDLAGGERIKAWVAAQTRLVQPVLAIAAPVSRDA